MSQRDQRLVRRRWRQRQRRKRDKDKEPSLLTPPGSPDSQPAPSRQKTSSTKKKISIVKKCKYDNKQLRNKLNQVKRKCNMYRKRLERAKAKDKPHASNKADTPKTKTRKLLRYSSAKTVRKTLDFHHVLTDQIKISYKGTNKSNKKRIKKTLTGSIIQKYKMQSALFQACEVKISRHKSRKQVRPKFKLSEITAFYERNDVSRTLTGVKQTVTFRKVKKQKRILNDTLKNLYIKYKCETQCRELCYSTFCKFRPFWVVFPTEGERNTCLCKTCDNTNFLACTLGKVDAIPTTCLESLATQIVCSTHNMDCMYRQCKSCSTKRIQFNEEIDNNDETVWHQWALKHEIREIKGVEKRVHYTVKETVVGTIGELCDKFEMEMSRYTRHLFNLRCQFKHYKSVTGNLKDDECAMNIDFSENYNCKMASEIQSMHFGAAKKQLTLHTGVYYIGTDLACSGQIQPHSFCSVSESLLHDPSAIWTHIEPVLKQIKECNPKIKKIHFFSDGPTVQYRQKGNFFLFSTKLNELGFEHGTWNFFEAGHGKGIPDAIGGALKRRADKSVLHGVDIMSAQNFIDCMTGSNVDVFHVSAECIEANYKILQKQSLNTVYGTLKLHQIFQVASQPATIQYRDVSCTCSPSKPCIGHEVKSAVLLTKQRFPHTAQRENTTTLLNGPEKGQGSTNTVIDTDRSDTLKKGQDCINTVNNTDRSDTFDAYLHQIQACSTYEELKRLCQSLADIIEPLDVLSQSVSNIKDREEIDFDALKLFPSDVHPSIPVYPGKSHADGNCFPSSASRFAYNTYDNTTEMRVRIIVESVNNEKSYLTSSVLARGLSAGYNPKDLPSQYAQYSPVYIPGRRLNKNAIRDIYRNEVMQIRRNREYMGIWQFHALASVLNSPIQSVYPQRGNPVVRKDLHRLIMPCQDNAPQKMSVHIMWTSTRTDMNFEYWVPNHFVPLLPIGNDANANIDLRNKEKDKSPDAEQGATQLLGKYVLVQYRGHFYPGEVTDVDEHEVYVNCMHRVGKKTNNCFFWPPRIKDQEWYSYLQVTCFSPLHQHPENARHYQLDKESWECYLQKYQLK